MNASRFFLKRHGGIRSPWVPALAAMLGIGVRLAAQSTPDIVWVTNAHGYGVTSVAFAGNSLSVASGSRDRTVQVWAITNALRLRVIGYSSTVLSTALSPDGSLVAAGGERSSVWRVSDGVRLWIGGPENELVYSQVFSPDGSLLAISRSDGINVRYADTGAGIPFYGPQGSFYQVAFASNGQTLASANANHLASLWRVPEGTLVRDFSGHSNAVNSVDFSPDGALLATASSDGTARLWRVADGAVVRVIEGGGGTAARFSADGQLLLTVNAGTIHVWRVADGHQLHSYTNAQAGPLDVASNGNYFAYGRADGAVVLARMPVWISEVRYQDNAVTLRWQGGSGRYQLQGRSSLASGEWQNLGPPTTNTTVTHSCLSPIFYRVESLPSP